MTRLAETLLVEKTNQAKENNKDVGTGGVIRAVRGRYQSGSLPISILSITVRRVRKGPQEAKYIANAGFMSRSAGTEYRCGGTSTPKSGTAPRYFNLVRDRQTVQRHVAMTTSNRRVHCDEKCQIESFPYTLIVTAIRAMISSYRCGNFVFG
jgi:hypothetical protein